LQQRLRFLLPQEVLQEKVPSLRFAGHLRLPQVLQKVLLQQRL
jgi:hypothetical protein